MSLGEILDSIREGTPELHTVVLVLLPEGIVIGSSGGESSLGNEPLARACRRCFSSETSSLPLSDEALEMREYLLINESEIYVFERGRQEPRLALAVACSKKFNASLLLAGARSALERAESAVDVAALEG